MQTRRIITGYKDQASKIKVMQKQATGFIDDWRSGDYLEPSLVRINDEDAFLFYERNDWISATINRIVDDCVKVTPRIIPKDKNAKISGRLKERIRIIKDFLDDPNKNKESFSDIREKVIKDLLIYGRSAIEKILLGNRRLVEIYVQNPVGLKVNADEHGNLREIDTYILIKDRKKEVKWNIDEMIFMVLKPTSKSVYGIKIMDSIVNTVATDILRATYNSKYFVNGANVDGILSLKEMHKKELKKFQDTWKSSFKGAKNAHKLAIVNVPIEFIKMTLTNQDMEFTEYGRELRTKIFAGFGMQPFVMGIIDQNTGKLNSGEQTEIYKNAALRPILRKEEYYYTNEIIKMGFGFKDIRFDFGEIDLVDVTAQTDIDVKDAQAGIRVINEIRAKRGLELVPWGNTPLSMAPGGGQVDPNTGRVLPPSQQGEEKPTKDPNSSKKPTKNYLISFAKSAKIKLKMALDMEIDFNRNVKIEELKKPIKIFVNSKVFSVNCYTVPVVLKHSKIYNFLENALDPSFVFDSEPDCRHAYFKTIASRIIFMFFNHLINRNIDNLFFEIDKIIYEEIETDFYREIF